MPSRLKFKKTIPHKTPFKMEEPVSRIVPDVRRNDVSHFMFTDKCISLIYPRRLCTWSMYRMFLLSMMRRVDWPLPQAFNTVFAKRATLLDRKYFFYLAARHVCTYGVPTQHEQYRCTANLEIWRRHTCTTSASSRYAHYKPSTQRTYTRLLSGYVSLWNTTFRLLSARDSVLRVRTTELRKDVNAASGSVVGATWRYLLPLYWTHVQNLCRDTILYRRSYANTVRSSALIERFSGAWPVDRDLYYKFYVNGEFCIHTNCRVPSTSAFNVLGGNNVAWSITCVLHNNVSALSAAKFYRYTLRNDMRTAALRSAVHAFYGSSTTISRHACGFDRYVKTYLAYNKRRERSLLKYYKLTRPSNSSKWYNW